MTSVKDYLVMEGFYCTVLPPTHFFHKRRPIKTVTLSWFKVYPLKFHDMKKGEENISSLI